MSDVTGAARWLEPSADMASRRNFWLACLIALTALLVLGNLANDAVLDMKYGWDTRVNCAAVDAYAGGLDPYFVKNLKGTKLSYPYLPVTLDVFRPLCAGGLLVDHYKGIFPVLAVLCGLLLPGLGRTRPSARDVALRVLCAIGAFVGFEWVQASGNFAILSGVLTAIALRFLLSLSASDAPEDSNFPLRLAGAALLGLVTSFKLVFFPVLAALYFLPLPRGRKLALIAVAAFSFALPILISRLMYPELFASWQLAMGGKIPDQHLVDLFEINPSLLLAARDLMDFAGFGGRKAATFATYAFAALALVLVPFAVSILRVVKSRPAPEGGSLLAQLDRWLMDHPRVAMRITVFAMFALYLSSPRLKEYAFFELALYAAILVVDLPALSLAAFLAVGLAFPALISILGTAFEGSFILLIIALTSFWILLLDFRAEPKRLETKDSRST
ncbi:hypothetical protein ABIF44_002035 [Bradyrhizobium japonicum]|uniref:hypothetical protein n=2 Tax=Nitrobacteraceae TaxID=41294 RepID=UPI000231C89B|nr:hypothetical protein RN69_20175 [Bradyrhizobium japonicum]KMJ96693.1 hypothetical protein CF64_25060 [Bradyrhizobium japonicum]BAL09426.1 hypothetical protein BJ6T_41520 [Bradyrhizobium japonicum USDA 6]GEC43104.1 hypothetical protein BJA01nite_07460 [Bradyrhizobium japonicum]